MSYQLIKPRLTSNRSPSALIHILDNDSLLNIFYLYRPVILDESEADDAQILSGGEWDRERWWYRLVQVCRRWRYIILESASYLRLALVCARGTPVADMLAHFPPLPIIIDHFDREHNFAPEDEEGVILALKHRDRVRRIRLEKPIPTLQKLLIGLDGVFPILEFLLIENQRHVKPTTENIVNLDLPETFRAPNLRHIVLMNFAIPIGSPIIATMGNLVTLSLNLIPPSVYFHPNALLQRLLHMPHLEVLGIAFNTHNGVERQLLRTPILTHVTLPNLRWLGFQGTNAYLEALLPRITIPLLEKLQIFLFNEPTYFIPHLQQFIRRNLRLNTITITFRLDHLSVKAYPHKGARLYTLAMSLGGRHLDHQVASAAQVFHSHGTVFSAAEHLILKSNRRSSEWISGANRTQWRELLGSFVNVKTLFVDGGLVRPLSRILQPGEGESPSELLPELQELSSSARGARRDAFTPFIDARQKAGLPVTLVGPSTKENTRTLPKSTGISS